MKQPYPVTPSSRATTFPPPDAKVLDDVKLDLLLISLRSGRTPFTGAIAAILIALIVSYKPDSAAIHLEFQTAIWLAAMQAQLLFSGLYATSQVRKGISEQNYQKVSWTYGLLGTLGAATWAISLLMLPHLDPLVGATLIAGLTMILCGGTVEQATHGVGVRLFAFPFGIVAALALLIRLDIAHAVLAIGFLLMAYHLTVMTSNVERLTSERLQLSILNARLIDKANMERSAAEAARAQADAARDAAVHADRAKTSFIAATSHDLRQPLHALVQHVADLRSRSLPAELSPSVERIDQAVTVMAELMDAVLDLSQVAAGDRLPDMRAISLRRLLAGVESQAFPSAQAKGLRLNFSADDGWVLSDEALLIRVIGNIVHNALRYTRQGKIVVRARRLRGQCRVTVADTGIGIPREARARIFDEYFQLHNPERDRRKGLGLGLSIVRELSRRLGLRVRLRSAVGRGTVFTIDIPEASVLAAPEHNLELPIDDRVKGALILLIDDDPMAREGMATTLRRIGCRVLSAANAAEAEGLLDTSEYAPQLILSDLRLGGGIDGAQLAAALSQRLQERLGPEFAPAVLIVTGDTQLESERTKLMLAASVLKKPVTPSTLYAAMNAALKTFASREGR